MTTKKMCDKCNKEIQPIESNTEVHFERQGNWDSNQSLDLCEHCAAQIKAWIQSWRRLGGP